MKNRVFIPIFYEAYLQGYQDSTNELPRIINSKEESKIDLKRIFFNSLLQSGAQEIVLNDLSLTRIKSNLPPNLAKRIKILELKDSRRQIIYSLKLRETLFGGVRSKILLNKENKNFIEFLSYHLSSILFCADKNMSLGGVRISTIGHNKINDIFKEDFSISLNNFLEGLKSSKILTPELSFTYKKRDIKILVEILKSNYYAKLSEEHLNLRDDSININHTINKINNLSKELKRTYDDELQVKENIFYALTLTEGILSSFSRLGKIFSQPITNRISNLLKKEDERLIIYDPSKMLNTIIKNQLMKEINYYFLKKGLNINFPQPKETSQ